MTAPLVSLRPTGENGTWPGSDGDTTRSLGTGVSLLGSASPSRRALHRFRPSIPRPCSGSSLIGVEGSTSLRTLSQSKGSRTVTNSMLEFYLQVQHLTPEWAKVLPCTHDAIPT